MSVTVQPAVSADLDDLIALNAVVQRLHAGAESAHFKPDLDREEVRAFFGRLLASDDTFVHIAHLNGAAAGYIWFEAQDRGPTPFTASRSRLYLHHIVVREDARRLGVASTLLGTAEQEARARGVGQIALDTWAFNVEAQAFFRAAGFTPSNIVLRKQLAA